MCNHAKGTIELESKGSEGVVYAHCPTCDEVWYGKKKKAPKWVKKALDKTK